MGGAELTEVCRLRRAPELFEVGALRDGEVVEDAAALIVDHDDREVATVTVGGEQRVAVVQESEVAAEEHRALAVE